MHENMNDSALVLAAPELPASMKAALEPTENVLAEQQNAERALQTARGALRQAEQELTEAQDKLAVAEAGAAVGGGDVDKAARKRLLGARDEADFARARVTGLEEHLRVTTAATEAQRDLAVQVRDWKREQAVTIVTEVYLPTINAVLDAMRLAAWSRRIDTGHDPSPQQIRSPSTLMTVYRQTISRPADAVSEEHRSMLCRRTIRWPADSFQPFVPVAKGRALPVDTTPHVLCGARDWWDFGGTRSGKGGENRADVGKCHTSARNAQSLVIACVF